MGLFQEVDKPAVYDTGFTATVIEGINRATWEQVAVKAVEKSKLCTETHTDSAAEHHARQGTLSEMERARAEIHIHNSIPSHPNVVPLLASEENHDHIILVTPLAEDGDLWQHIRFSATLSEVEARNLVGQLLSGLSHLHRCRLVHGDVKPHNVLLFRGREENEENGGNNGVRGKKPLLMAQFCDFGLSEQVHLGADGSPHLVPFTSLRGSSGYFSPEMINCEDYGFPVDVFAVGIIMFRVLGGYEPFYPATKFLEQVEFEDPMWEDISQECKDLIQRLLRLNQRERITADDALGHPWFSINLQPPHTTESTLYFFPWKDTSNAVLKNCSRIPCGVVGGGGTTSPTSSWSAAAAAEHNRSHDFHPSDRRSRSRGGSPTHPR